MRETRFVVLRLSDTQALSDISWVIFALILLLFVHGAWADGVTGTVNKDGSMTLSKSDLLKLSQFIGAQNTQLQKAVHEGKAWHDRYEEAHDCVMSNALAGLATTTCFEICPHTNRFCGPETQEY